MAWTISTEVLEETQRHLYIKIAGVSSDATELSDQVIVDASAYTGPQDQTVDRFSVRQLHYSCQGLTYLDLEFDATTDDLISRLHAGSDWEDWREFGGFADPKSTGYTGDILLTSVGAAANSSFEITLHLVKKI